MNGFGIAAVAPFLRAQGEHEFSTVAAARILSAVMEIYVERSVLAFDACPVEGNLEGRARFVSLAFSLLTKSDGSARIGNNTIKSIHSPQSRENDVWYYTIVFV